MRLLNKPVREVPGSNRLSLKPQAMKYNCIDCNPRTPRLTRVIGKIGECVAVLLASWSFLSQAQTTTPERLFQQAVDAQQRGDDATAVIMYKALLRMHPEAVAVRVNLGAALAQLKRFDESIEQYRIVLMADPKNKLAQMNLALAYREDGQLAPAIRALERLHREDPEEQQTLILLADCYLQSRLSNDAVSLLAPLESTHPGNLSLEWLLGSALIQVGREAEGVERIEAVAVQNRSAEAYLLAGQTRLGMSQYDLAQKDANAAMELNPQIAGLNTLLGMIQEQTANYEAAEKSLLLGLAEDPNDFNALYYLGAIYYFKRDLVKARMQLTRALQLQPNSAQALFEMALVTRAEGHIDEAVRDLERVTHESPAWLQPHVELSALYYRQNRPKDGAIQKQIVDRIMSAQQQSASQDAH